MSARQQIVDRLLAAHETWFDVERDYAFAGRVFPGYAEFRSSASQYVLVKRAKLWEAHSFEYLFFWSTPRLAAAEFRDLVHFMKTDALAKVRLVPDHMSSYLSLVIVADEVEPGLERAVQTTRFRKNFAWGLKGWADLRVAVVDGAARCVYTNNQGKPLKETLAANAFARCVSPDEEGDCLATEAELPGALPSRAEGDATAEARAVRVSGAEE